MRKIALIIAFCVGLFLSIALPLWVIFIQPIISFMEPATPENSRKDIVSAKTDAVILMPFVTGDVPRLIRADSLLKWSRNLWFTNNYDVGNVFSATLSALAGGPFKKDIGTAFKSGVPVENFSCVSGDCINWPKEKTYMWGLSPLNGLGAKLGPEVKREYVSFSDYGAYRAAHDAINNDPLRWFATSPDTVLKPAPDGTRSVVITLPARLIHILPSTTLTARNTALNDELKTLALQLIDGLQASVMIDGTDSLPIWVTRYGYYVRDAQGGRVLPELASTAPRLYLTVMAEDIPIIQKRFEAANIQPADFSAITPAIADAYRTWGLATSCLPGCGGIDSVHNLTETAEIYVSPPPTWDFSFWHIPPAD